jgi:hypothetical protein
MYLRPILCHKYAGSVEFNLNSSFFAKYIRHLIPSVIDGHLPFYPNYRLACLPHRQATYSGLLF